MIYTSIYFILLLFMLINCIIKKYNIIAVLLVGLYCFVGFFAVYASETGILDASKVTLLPYLFLIVCYYLFFQPFFHTRTVFSSGKIEINIPSFYRFLLIIYIFSTLVYLYVFIPKVLQIAAIGQWNVNYNSRIETGEFTFTYSNTFEWAFTQIHNFTGLLSLIVSFLYLRTKRYRALSFITLALYLGSEFCAAMYVSSRGMLLTTAFLLVALCLFVFPELQGNVKAILIFIFAICLYAFIPYVIDVTVSRFSGNNANSSIVSYFGQAPIIFNTGVATIDRLSFGKFTIGKLFGIDTFNQSAVGGSWGAGFCTFVGWLYVDWGPFVILIGLLFNRVLNHIILQPYYKVSQIYFVFYYYYILSSGVFAIGRAQITNIVMMIVLLIIINFLENHTFVVNGKPIFKDDFFDDSNINE